MENSIHLNRIAPIYPLTEGLPQRWLALLLWRVVAEFAPASRSLIRNSADPRAS